MELPSTTIPIEDVRFLLGKAGFIAYARLGPQHCPSCGQTMNGTGIAFWIPQSLIRSQWRCINRYRCERAAAQTTHNLSTTIV